MVYYLVDIFILPPPSPQPNTDELGRTLSISNSTNGETNTGIDVDKIEQLFNTPEAEQLFRENIKRAAELDIKASPTILVDNHQFPTNQLLRASGTPCQ